MLLRLLYKQYLAGVLQTFKSQCTKTPRLRTSTHESRNEDRTRGTSSNWVWNGDLLHSCNINYNYTKREREKMYIRYNSPNHFDHMTVILCFITTKQCVAPLPSFYVSMCHALLCYRKAFHFESPCLACSTIWKLP